MVSTGVVLLGLGFLTFFLGLIQCLSSRKFLGFLFGVEIIINSTNLNLLGFIELQPNRSDIQPLIIMIIAFAVLETVIGLAVFSWASKITGTDPAISLV